MTETNKIKLIIFDWDDVFTIGSMDGYFECYHQALNGVGVQLDPDEERRCIVVKWGQHHREVLKEHLKKHPELLDKACEIYEQHLFGDTFVDSVSIMPGAMDLLKKLHKKYKQALATGADPDVFKNRIVPKFKVPNVFSQIIFAADLLDPTKGKPHPFMIQQILKSQKIKPQEAIFVGDAGNDVLMAQAAGVTPVVVLSGHLNKSEAEKLGVEYIIPDITYLEKVLDDINAASKE